MAGDGRPPTSFTLENSKFIINELLFYVSTWLSVVPFDMLLEMCTKFYTEDEISTAKSLLFEATAARDNASRLKKRRDGLKPKRVADMEDLIRELLAAEGDDGCQLPIFLAFDGRRLPIQVEGAQVSNEALSCELRSLKGKVEEIQSLLLNNPPSRDQNLQDNITPKEVDGSPLPTVITPRPQGEEGGNANVSASFAEIVRTGSKVQLNNPAASTDEEGFKTVVSKRMRKQAQRTASVVGTKCSGTGPRGVPTMPRFCWLYVGRCEPRTTAESLSASLQEEGITVLQGHCLASNDQYCSFKIKIALEQRENAMQPGVWGAGICVRQFYIDRRASRPVAKGGNLPGPATSSA